MQPNTKHREEDVLPNLTPRSEKACLLAGVEPRELVPLALEAFAEPGQPAALQQLKWQRYEDVRQDAFRAVQLERDRILNREARDNASSVSNMGQSGTGGANVLHEQRLVEKIKRRQQADIEGMFFQEIKNLKVQEEKADRIRTTASADARKQMERERRVRENAETRRIHDIEVRRARSAACLAQRPFARPMPPFEQLPFPRWVPLPRRTPRPHPHPHPAPGPAPRLLIRPLAPHLAPSLAPRFDPHPAARPHPTPHHADVAHEERGGAGARVAEAARGRDGEGV